MNISKNTHKPIYICDKCNQRIDYAYRQGRKIYKYYSYDPKTYAPKKDLVQIDKNKYFIEVENGKFVDVKKLYYESISKQKAKEALDDIYDYFERLNVPDEDIEYIESKRKELLEEGE